MSGFVLTALLALVGAALGGVVAATDTFVGVEMGAILGATMAFAILGFPFRPDDGRRF